MFLRAGALSASLAAAACAGALEERVYGQAYLPAYSPLGFSAFAAAGPLVEVRGAPPDGAGAEAVAAALRLPGRFPHVPFRAVAPGAAPTSQRIVLAFGLRAADPARMCAGEVEGGAQTDGLSVAAAFCVGSRPASSAVLAHERPLGVGDPAFTDAMRRLFAQLAPSRDPQQDRDDCRLGACD